MSVAHKFERLQSSSDPAFEDFYRIYTESIVERERKSRAWISEMVARPDYVTVLLKEDGRVEGFSILCLPQEDAFGLLEYMAVAGDQRSRGLGAELFQYSMQTALEQRGRPMPVLLEVDSDREDSADRKLRTRRQRFYRRLGCFRIAGLAYILPLPGEAPPPEMDLMIYPNGDLRELPKADLERWLKVIYRIVYNCSPEDPRIKRMLQAIPDRVPFE
jgi:GNAT superfamily N-acetyltransferase